METSNNGNTSTVQNESVEKSSAVYLDVYYLFVNNRKIVLPGEIVCTLIFRLLFKYFNVFVIIIHIYI